MSRSFFSDGKNILPLTAFLSSLLITLCLVFLSNSSDLVFNQDGMTVVIENDNV